MKVKVLSELAVVGNDRRDEALAAARPRCLIGREGRFATAAASLLIADIDAPRRGLIHVRPQNLEALAKSFGR